jgi:hypothetical protein
LGCADFQLRASRAIRRHWQLLCCTTSFCWRAALRREEPARHAWRHLGQINLNAGILGQLPLRAAVQRDQLAIRYNTTALPPQKEEA